MRALFADRHDAGRQLARRLGHLRGADTVVLALPRGGVPVGFEVAHALSAPLDVVVVRKIGAPSNPELALGALGPGGAYVLDRGLMERLSVAPQQLQEIIDKERAELVRRQRLYRQGRAHLDVVGKTVIVVDDGVATGASARAALEVLPHLGPRRVVLAVPVMPGSLVGTLKQEVDELVYVHAPDDFIALGAWYRRFEPLTDDDVLSELGATTAAGH